MWVCGHEIVQSRRKLMQTSWLPFTLELSFAVLKSTPAPLFFHTGVTSKRESRHRWDKSRRYRSRNNKGSNPTSSHLPHNPPTRLCAILPQEGKQAFRLVRNGLSFCCCSTFSPSFAAPPLRTSPPLCPHIWKPAPHLFVFFPFFLQSFALKKKKKFFTLSCNYISVCNYTETFSRPLQSAAVAVLTWQ